MPHTTIVALNKRQHTTAQSPAPSRSSDAFCLSSDSSTSSIGPAGDRPRVAFVFPACLQDGHQDRLQRKGDETNLELQHCLVCCSSSDQSSEVVQLASGRLEVCCARLVLQERGSIEGEEGVDVGIAKYWWSAMVSLYDRGSCAADSKGTHKSRLLVFVAPSLDHNISYILFLDGNIEQAFALFWCHCSRHVAVFWCC